MDEEDPFNPRARRLGSQNPDHTNMHSFCSYSSSMGSQTSLHPPAPAVSNAPMSEYMWVKKKNNLGGRDGKWHQKFEPYPSHLSHFFLQEPHSSFRGKSTVWECASDRTRLSTPIGALGPRGQVLPMMSFLSQLNSGSGFLRNNSLLFLSFFLTWWLS